jgi:hypothetical protein
MSMKRRKLLITTGLAVVLAALVNFKAIPIYDGINAPDQPYRYASAPSGLKKTEPPSTASGVFNVAQVKDVYGVGVSSSEFGPQVSVTLGQNTLILPAKTNTVSIRAVPEAPSTQPNDGRIAGNVYAVNISSEAGAVKINPAHSKSTYIDLRLPQGFTAKPVMEYKPANSSWRQLTTTQVGSDIYESKLKDIGDYALVIAKQGSPNDKSQGVIIIAIAAVIAIMAGIILAVRRSGSKQDK